MSARTLPAPQRPATGGAGIVAPALARAQQHLAAGAYAEAEALLLPLHDDALAGSEARYLLAVGAVMAGRAEQAVARAQQAVSAQPDDARCHFVLGRAHKLAGRLANAVAAYRHALVLQPAYVEAHVSLGIALKHGGDLQAAVACYEQALALQPGFAAAQANLAYAHAALAEQQAGGGGDELPTGALIEDTERAAAADPGNASLYFNLGLLLRCAQRRGDAVNAFNRALGLRPADVGYCLNLAHELVAVGHRDPAIHLLRTWIGRYAPNPTVMRVLADQLSRSGAVSEALEWGRRAYALEPDPLTLLHLCGANQQARRLVESLAAGRQAIEQSGRLWKMYSIPLLVASYQHEDPQPIADFHAEFGQALRHAFPAVARPRPQPLQRRLRLGYLSPDFSMHSVAFFMQPLLERHDRSRFEVFCYHNSAQGDEMTAHLKSLGHPWATVEHLSDDALARRIQQDGIDILVDLAGHTAGGRIGVFARGPAPLQVSYLGYPTATGVPLMDHRISDAHIDPGDVPGTGSETPLCLPGSMFCYRAPASPPIGPLPSVRNGYVTFGSFNNHAKISDHCLALWAELLNAVPGSRLLLKSGAVADAGNRAELVAFMAARGVVESRLDLRAHLAARDAHLRLYDEIDVALDPFPYNGATTTCEALWMGVPVVTRRGRTHTSRMGASILAAAGRPGWVAHDDAGWLALAAATAQDVPGRAAWRQGARAALEASALCDEPAFVRGFEQLLERAWQQHG